MSENEIKQIIKDESVYAQKFWKLHDILIKKAHENYDRIDEDAVYEVDLDCISDNLWQMNLNIAARKT